jgi:hypothetical protein
MTRDEWVQAALAARAEQGLPEHIEDPATLDFLADVLSTPDATAHTDRSTATS